MEELLGGVSLTDGARHLSQRVGDKFAVRLTKIGGLGAVADEPLCLRDTIGEVGRDEVHVPHPPVELFKRLRILRRCDVTREQRLVVGPESDGEAVLHVDAWLRTRVERRHGRADLDQLTSDLDLERCAPAILDPRHPGQNVTGPQAHGEPIRLVDNSGLIDL